MASADQSKHEEPTSDGNRMSGKLSEEKAAAPTSGDGAVDGGDEGNRGGDEASRPRGHTEDPDRTL